MRCGTCQDETPVYIGESSRNLYTRAKEHRQAYRRGGDNSFMAKHQAEKHQGERGVFTAKVVKTFKDCLTRQISEGIYIRRSEVPVMNTKSEWHQPSLWQVQSEIHRGWVWPSSGLSWGVAKQQFQHKSTRNQPCSGRWKLGVGCGTASVSQPHYGPNQLTIIVAAIQSTEFEFELGWPRANMNKYNEGESTPRQLKTLIDIYNYLFLSIFAVFGAVFRRFWPSFCINMPCNYATIPVVWKGRKVKQLSRNTNLSKTFLFLYC